MEWKYLDKVRVKSGFFENQEGVLLCIDSHQGLSKDFFIVDIQLENGYIIREDTEVIEKVEKEDKWI